MFKTQTRLFQDFNLLSYAKAPFPASLSQKKLLLRRWGSHLPLSGLLPLKLGGKRRRKMAKVLHMLGKGERCSPCRLLPVVLLLLWPTATSCCYLLHMVGPSHWAFMGPLDGFFEGFMVTCALSSCLTWDVVCLNF